MSVEFLTGLQKIIPETVESGFSSKPAAGEEFSEALTKAAMKFVDHKKAAETAVGKFANGMDGNLHETMLTVEKADISLKFMVSVRNKLLEAYREIMQMGG